MGELRTPPKPPLHLASFPYQRRHFKNIAKVFAYYGDGKVSKPNTFISLIGEHHQWGKNMSMGLMKDSEHSERAKGKLP